MWKCVIADASTGAEVNSTPAKVRLEYFFVASPAIWTSSTSAASHEADQVSTGELV